MDIIKQAIKAKEDIDNRIMDWGEEIEANIEANTESGLIPNSWIDDNGLRHAVIVEPLMPEYLRLEKVDGEWKLKERMPF